MDDKETLDALKRVMGSEFIDSLVARANISSYQDFVEDLYTNLDSAIKIIQQNKMHRARDCEDRITIDLVTILKERGISAEHDAYHNGNVDFKVSHKCYPEEFIWLGEAKIYRGPSTAWEGYLQLSTRYLDQGGDKQQGGVILYVKEHTIATVMERWVEDFQAKAEDMFKCEIQINWDKSPSNTNAFYSTHEHPDTKLPLKIRHIPVNLHHNPVDRSGRKSSS